MNYVTSSADERARKGVPAVERAMRILQIVADQPAGRSFREIQKLSGVPRSSCHLLVDTLMTLGALQQIDAHLYRCGPLLFELGAAFQRGNDIVKSFSRHAKGLVSATGEAAQCAILDGREVLYVAIEPGLHPIRLGSSIGTRLPAYATALGKVLLAALPINQLRNHLPEEPFPALTDKTLNTTAALARELMLVRERGYAIDDEGVLVGLCCLSAPIRNSDGSVVASLSISLPTDRFKRNGEAVLSEAVKSTAHAVSQELGYTPGADQGLTFSTNRAIAY